MLDIASLVAPLAAAIPSPFSPGLSASVSGVRGLQDLGNLAASALQGRAGDNVHGSLDSVAKVVSQALGAGDALDKLAGQAAQAVERAIGDLSVIFDDCVREVGQAVATSGLAGPLGWANGLGAAMPVVVRHVGRAEGRVHTLEEELRGLTLDVQQVEKEQIPERLPARNPDTAEVAAPASPDNNSAPGAPTDQAQKAVAAAKTALGTPYQWGGTVPGKGLDCSGLVQWAYQQAGVDLPRTASAQAVGPQIPRAELQAGDLAVWDGHVAMIVDGGNMIEAGDPVQINPIRQDNIGMPFKGFYRPTAA
ncbi:C40 family peptidase [Corynebacterium jeikeium]|uniref:C40 family peptidase n=1 Tax=Corynebacterium jeikeium TaxID=38289 RepID=UPI000558B9BD|nr:C40 family peptidase [Corynebacterium jeikeium]